MSNQKNNALTPLEFIVLTAAVCILAATLIPSIFGMIKSENSKIALAEAGNALTSFVESAKPEPENAICDIVMFVQCKDSYYIYGYHASHPILMQANGNPFKGYASFDDLIDSDLLGAYSTFVLAQDDVQNKKYTNLYNNADNTKTNVRIYKGYLSGNTSPTGIFTACDVTYLPGEGVGLEEVMNMPVVSNTMANSQHRVRGEGMSRLGYVFAGWYNQANLAEQYTVGQSLIVTEPITLVANWMAIENYTLTFDANGGTASFPFGIDALVTTLPRGTNITDFVINSSSILAGRNFLGWKDVEGNLYNNQTCGALILLQNMTLTAVWDSYDIAFDPGTTDGANISEMPNALSFDTGMQGQLPISIPTRDDGFVFYRWHCNELDMDFAPNATLCGGMTPYSLTFTALWSKPEFTVEFDANGQNVTNMPPKTSQTVQTKPSNALYTLPEAPIRENYRFLGWAGTADGTLFQANETFIYNKDFAGHSLTFTASWIRLYKLTYRNVAESTDVISEQYLSYGELTALGMGVTTPTNNDNIFAGWVIREGSPTANISRLYQHGEMYYMAQGDVYVDSYWAAPLYS